jgi:hypothetical protein
MAVPVAGNAYLTGRFSWGWHVPYRLLEAVAKLSLPLAPEAPPWLMLAGAVGSAGLVVLAVAGRRPAGRLERPAALLAAAIALLTLMPVVLARDLVESRWLYLPLVSFAAIVAMALDRVAALAARLSRRPLQRLALAVLVAAHVLAQGAAMRAKIARDHERAQAFARLAGAAVSGASGFPRGARVAVVIDPDQEPRGWPLGASLQAGPERALEFMATTDAGALEREPYAIDLRSSAPAGARDRPD